MLLSLSHILHLLATVIWLGGLFVLALLAWGGARPSEMAGVSWVGLQRRLLPWIQASLAVLLVTGFYQMTVDPQYAGLLRVEGVWGWAMLLKHIAYLGLVGGTLYWQFSLLPEIDRVQLLLARRPDSERAAALERKEKRLLIVNCGLAVVILVFTGIMTAV